MLPPATIQDDLLTRPERCGIVEVLENILVCCVHERRAFVTLRIHKTSVSACDASQDRRQRARNARRFRQ